MAVIRRSRRWSWDETGVPGILGRMKPSPEIEAIVRRLVAARAAGDSGAVTSLYSSSKHLLLVGSDEHEWFQGADVSRIVQAHRSELGSHDSELLRVYAYEAGKVGWAAVEERRTYSTGRSTVDRWTVVFELAQGSWQMVQSHFSHPVPNVDVLGIELSRTLSELVESMGAESADSTRMAPTGTATLMFTDIVGSTALATTLGEAAWLAVIETHLRATKRTVEAVGGEVVKTLGDGGMFAFPTGTSALNAAMGIQREVAAQPFEVRVGIHTGDIVRSDGDYLGSTVAKAARIAAAADGGQVLVSSTTVGMLNPKEFGFGVPINVELQGLNGTHELRPLSLS